jgi:hypothetical protein
MRWGVGVRGEGYLDYLVISCIISALHRIYPQHQTRDPSVVIRIL